MRDMKWFGDQLPADGSATLRRHDLGVVHGSGSGGRGRATSCRRSRRRDISHEGFPFARCRWIEIGPVRVLASRISYVGELGWELYAPMEQGARDVGRALGGGPAARHGPVRDRRLRDDRPDREGLPALRRRARVGVQRRRGRDAAADGEGLRLRRQGGAPAPPRGGAGGDPLHADDRRPDLVVGREALPDRPRADPDARTASAIVDAHGPRVVRDERRLGAVGREARADGVPAAGARRRGQQAAGPVHGRALSGHGRGRRLAVAVRSREHAGADARWTSSSASSASPRRARGSRSRPTSSRSTRRTSGFTISPHEECAVEEAMRIGERRRPCSTLGPAAAVEQLQNALAMGIGRPCCSRPTATTGGRRRRRRRSRTRCAGAAFDLLLFGNESADNGNYQVAIRVAAALGLPWVTGIKGDRDRRRRRARAARGGRRLGGLRAAAAGGGGRARGNQPAALPVAARPAAREEGGDRARSRRSGARTGSRRCGSWCRRRRRRRSRSSATGRARAARRGAAARARAGGVVNLVFVEPGQEELSLPGGRGRAAARRAGRGGHVRRFRGVRAGGVGAGDRRGGGGRVGRAGRGDRPRLGAARVRGGEARRAAGGELRGGRARRSAHGHAPALGRKPARGGARLRAGQVPDGDAARVRRRVGARSASS